MRGPFMWMMWETWKRISKDGRMKEPEKVVSATAMYRKQNDIFLQFIAEKIIFDPDNEKAMLSVPEAYNSFKTWFTDSYPNLHGKMPNKEMMRDELIRKWGDLSSRQKWAGYRLRTMEDDEREGKAIIIREEDLAQVEDKKAERKAKIEEESEDDESDDQSESDEEGNDDEKSVCLSERESEEDLIVIGKKKDEEESFVVKRNGKKSPVFNKKKKGMVLGKRVDTDEEDEGSDEESDEEKEEESEEDEETKIRREKLRKYREDLEKSSEEESEEEGEEDE